VKCARCVSLCQLPFSGNGIRRRKISALTARCVDSGRLEQRARVAMVTTVRELLRELISSGDYLPGLPRAYLLIQFVSQVLPPSSENACSDCAESLLIFQMENRTQTYLPLICS
jgi:hypothetical protein